MDLQILLMVLAFLAAGSLAALVVMLLAGNQSRLQTRLHELSGGVEDSQLPAKTVSRAVHKTLPKMGKHLMPTDTEEQTRLKARLIQAGFYHPQGMAMFLGAKMLLTVVPVLAGLGAGLAGFMALNYGLLIGACASIAGMIGPSFWLDGRKQKRLAALRRSMPDALDLIVVCMDGGLSLPAALQRVTGELNTAHPVLAFELNIVEREIHFGQPVGDALRSFALRSDLDDVRNLAATIKNAERFGASMTQTLRTYADTLRLKRQQHAEEMAQKAGTKILFPTLVFIFPAIFLVILGPAAIQLLQTLGN